MFAAASLTDALTELGREYRDSTGTEVLFNFAGSNVLAQQLLARSSADLILSASEEWVDTLVAAGRVREEDRIMLLGNRMLVIGNRGGGITLDTPCDLSSVEELVLADPDAVPAGRYARQWLESITCDGQSLWSILSGRVVPTPDVRAGLALTAAREGAVGIIYESDLLMAPASVTPLHLVVNGPEISYPAALLAESDRKEEAERFLEYLRTRRAAEIFTAYGFTPLATAVGETVVQ